MGCHHGMHVNKYNLDPNLEVFPVPQHEQLLSYASISATALLACRLNKYILDPKLGGFPFPLTLTATHMLFCAVVSWLLVKAKLIDAPAMPNDVYIRCAHPCVAWVQVQSVLHVVGP
jgi:hypothetical protein